MMIQQIFYPGRDTKGEAEQGECSSSTGASYADRCHERVASWQRWAHTSAYGSSSCSTICRRCYGTGIYPYSCPRASSYSHPPVIDPRSTSTVPPTRGGLLPST